MGYPLAGVRGLRHLLPSLVTCRGTRTRSCCPARAATDAAPSYAPPTTRLFSGRSQSSLGESPRFTPRTGFTQRTRLTPHTGFTHTKPHTSCARCRFVQNFDAQRMEAYELDGARAVWQKLQLVRSLCEIEFELDRISAHLVEELATQRGLRGDASLPTSPKDRAAGQPLSTPPKRTPSGLASSALPAELQSGPGSLMRQRPSYSSALGRCVPPTRLPPTRLPPTCLPPTPLLPSSPPPLLPHSLTPCSPPHSSALGSLGDLSAMENDVPGGRDPGGRDAGGSSSSHRMPIPYLPPAASDTHGRSVSMDNSDLPLHLDQEIAEPWRQRPVGGYPSQGGGYPAGRPEREGSVRGDGEGPRSRMSSINGLTEVRLPIASYFSACPLPPAACPLLSCFPASCLLLPTHLPRPPAP